MSYYNILPISLPGKCIDADEGLNEETWLLDQDVFVDCNEGDKGQDWILHQQGTIVQWESAKYPGTCIATVHDHNVVNRYLVQVDLSHRSLMKYRGLLLDEDEATKPRAPGGYFYHPKPYLDW